MFAHEFRRIFNLKTQDKCLQHEEGINRVHSRNVNNLSLRERHFSAVHKPKLSADTEPNESTLPYQVLDATQTLAFAASPTQHTANLDLLMTQRTTRNAFNTSYGLLNRPQRTSLSVPVKQLKLQSWSCAKIYIPIEATMNMQVHQTGIDAYELQQEAATTNL